MTPAAVELAGGCLRCGRCSAACPNEALSLEGHGMAVSAQAGEGALTVECWKVDPSRATRNAARLPCLGALSTGRVLELWQAAGEAGLELMDRGWCGACSAGGGDCHPAQRALDAANLWLEALGVEKRRQARLVQRPLPAKEMAAEIPAPESVRPISRRQFLRSISAPVPVGGAGAPAFPAGKRHESAERRRTLNALAAIAEERGAVLPEELFPRVANSGACADHRICTGACPTGALTVNAVDGRAALEFDAETCIACGACERACPEHALSLDAHGGRRGRRIVALHRQQRCASCAETYSAKEADDGLCLSCRKTRKFLRSGAALWRAARQ
ncbi:MAG TPA: 4Fe-4S dicluster domain-containing protein [Burkholderiales bacterium]